MHPDLSSSLSIMGFSQPKLVIPSIIITSKKNICNMADICHHTLNQIKQTKITLSKRLTAKIMIKKNRMKLGTNHY